MCAHIDWFIDCCSEYIPDSKVHGANMGRQYPGRPHDGPMNFAIVDIT